MISVDVYVKDSQVSPQPVLGVQVGVFNPTTLALLTIATTDSSGHAGFMLTGSASPGTAYELRFYKQGGLFTQPVEIKVIDPLGMNQTNKFDVTMIDGTALSVGSDPNMCRCQGFFLDLSNQPLRNILVRISANPESGFQTPKVLNGNMVAADAIEVRTDANGKVVVDLIRNGKFDISFAGEDDIRWSMVIPDQAAVNIVDLIHPKPKLLTWDQTIAPGNALSIAVGQTVIVPYTVTFSDYEVLSEDMAKWITLTNSDGTKMDLATSSGPAMVQVSGIAPGVATVTAGIQPGILPLILPTPVLSAALLTVTVS